MPPVISESLCNRCGTCYELCPQDVFLFTEGEVPDVAYPYECWYCGTCVVDCPTEAVHLELPLRMHIVPSPALYGVPGPDEREMARRAAAFTRSVLRD